MKTKISENETLMNKLNSLMAESTEMMIQKTKYEQKENTKFLEGVIIGLIISFLVTIIYDIMKSLSDFNFLRWLIFFVLLIILIIRINHSRKGDKLFKNNLKILDTIDSYKLTKEKLDYIEKTMSVDGAKEFLLEQIAKYEHSIKEVKRL